MTDLVYATSPFVRFAPASAVPASTVHAKVLGTTRTLCGIECESWRKFLDQPFAKARGPRCSRCTSALTGGRDR